jgi:hypothetical protein
VKRPMTFRTTGIQVIITVRFKENNPEHFTWIFSGLAFMIIEDDEIVISKSSASKSTALNYPTWKTVKSWTHLNS